MNSRSRWSIFIIREFTKGGLEISVLQPMFILNMFFNHLEGKRSSEVLLIVSNYSV